MEKYKFDDLKLFVTDTMSYGGLKKLFEKMIQFVPNTSGNADAEVASCILWDVPVCLNLIVLHM